MILHGPAMHPDEEMTVKTIHHIHGTGTVPVFKLGQDYMCPVEDVLGAALSALGASDKIAARAPAAVLTSIGVVLLFLFFQQVGIPRIVRFAATLPLVVCNSAIARFTASGIGEYGFGLLFSTALPLLCLFYDRKASNQRLFLIGAFAGFGLYVFNITAMTTVTCLVWLLARSSGVERVAKRPECRRVLIVGGGLVVAAILLAAPAVYRFMVYRTMRFIPYWLLLFTAAGLATIALYTMQRRLRLVDRQTLISLSLLGIPLVALSLSPVIYDKAVVEPWLEREMARSIPQPTYIWKNVHEWGGQVRLLAARVLPLFLEGRLQHAQGGEIAGTLDNLLAPRSLRSVSAIVGVVFYLGWLIRYGLRHDRRDSELFMLVGPALLLTAVAFPSWRLFGDYSFRYWCPFYPAVCAVVAGLPRLLQGGHLWTSAVAVASAVGLTIYNACDYMAFLGL